MFEKDFFDMVISVIFWLFVFYECSGEEVIKKEIFSIPEPTWIFNAGMDKEKKIMIARI